jgi:hypothetical protein
MDLNIKYFLSFDCATKTFAYILVKIDFNLLYIDNEPVRKILNYIKEQLNNGIINQEILDILDKIDKKTKYVITIIKADCIDLAPGIRSRELTTVERVKMMSLYVKKYIYPIITSDLIVLIEFQMSQNVQSRAISIGLVALFAEHEVHFVNPSLKNKINLSEEGQYYNFIQKYKNSYDANKKHALFNFKTFEQITEQILPISDRLKGHIADSFMQIIGHLAYT